MIHWKYCFPAAKMLDYSKDVVKDVFERKKIQFISSEFYLVKIFSNLTEQSPSFHVDRWVGRGLRWFGGWLLG